VMLRISAIWWDFHEWAYGRIHRLQNVGPVLRVGLGRYRESPLTFLDGTVIKDGDWVGELHLQNQFISTFQTESRMPGLRFRREFKRSLRALASLMVEDPRYHGIKAWWGTTWSTKGAERSMKRLGFEQRSIENSRERERLKVHYEALLRHYGGGSKRGSITPMTFWITSRELLRRYGGEE